MKTATTKNQWAVKRLAGLRRFALAITLFNVIGHLYLGFEQSFAQPLVAVAAACSLELLLEWIGARREGRAARFQGGLVKLTDFLLPAHIGGLAVSMLLYANDRLLPIAFASAAAIASKAVFQAPAGKGSRHFFNPSNFGISLTLICFPWVGMAPPYHFSENVSGLGDWILPALIVVSGTALNARFAGRLPLIGAWLACFAAQAAIRSWAFETPLAATLMPMTGVAFILYTFYMITDPATSPARQANQIVFGGAVAAVYGILVAVHVVFGLFFALTIVSAMRGAILTAKAWLSRGAEAPVTIQGSPRLGRAES